MTESLLAVWTQLGWRLARSSISCVFHVGDEAYIRIADEPGSSPGQTGYVVPTQIIVLFETDGYEGFAL